MQAKRHSGTPGMPFFAKFAIFRRFSQLLEVNLYVKDGKIYNSVLYRQISYCYIAPQLNNNPQFRGYPKRG